MAKPEQNAAALPGQAAAQRRSIFAAPSPESGFTYEEEQAAMKWQTDPTPQNLRALEALIDNQDRHVDIMQWAHAQADQRRQNDAAELHGMPGDDHPGQGGGRR